MNTDIPGDPIVSEEVLADIAGAMPFQCYGVLAWLNQLPLMVLQKFLPQSPCARASSSQWTKMGCSSPLCRSRAWGQYQCRIDQSRRSGYLRT